MQQEPDPCFRLESVEVGKRVNYHFWGRMRVRHMPLRNSTHFTFPKSKGRLNPADTRVNSPIFLQDAGSQPSPRSNPLIYCYTTDTTGP